MSTTAIPAKLVMALRERTGAAMMECKKFLIATQGDIEAAIIKMREAGQAQADHKAGRIAAEGLIVVAITSDKKEAVILEVNSETDFVARATPFIEFSQATVEALLNHACCDLDALKACSLPKQHMTVEVARQQLVTKMGENIQLRRFKRLTTEGLIGSYQHGSKIGVLVSLAQADPELAKDIAMHIAAFKPLVIHPHEVPSTLIHQERAIYTAQANDSGKPVAIVEKIVQGRIQKFLDEVSLVKQSFVKNPEMTVEQWLKEKNNQVLAFVRFAVGEGIEKKQDHFVQEVLSQVKE